MTDLLPCPFCGSPARDDLLPHVGGPGWVQCSECECGQHMSDTLEEAVKRWNTRAGGQRSEVQTEALRLLAAEDARQSKLHELLETIREQIRLEVAPEHRPNGLFKNIQDAVYAMRGRTWLMNDAAITGAFASAQAPRSPQEIQAIAAGAIRTFCKSLGGEPVQKSHGVERIYYSGLSLDALSAAVALALSSATRATPKDFEETFSAETFVMGAFFSECKCNSPLILCDANGTRCAKCGLPEAVAISSTDRGSAT